MERPYSLDLRERVVDAAAARPQGRPRTSKLDPHEAFLRGLIAKKPDLTLEGMRARLLAEYGLKIKPAPPNAGDIHLKIVLREFNAAYNSRRQRVLDGLSPEMLLRQRPEAEPALANPTYKSPSPRTIKQALCIVADAKVVSHPDRGTLVAHRQRRV